MRLILLVFVTICIFDPADAMIGGKPYVFGLLWLLTILRMPVSTEVAKISEWMLAYVLLFIAIPILSILWYCIYDGRQPFDGLLYLKGYLLISLVLVLQFNKIDLVPMLSAVLVALALITIAVFVGILIYPELYNVLKRPGLDTGLVYLHWRTYGNLTLLQAHFVTSPMLVLPIAYYFDRAMTSERKSKYLTLCMVCIAGMIAAGTRNNLFVALLLPTMMWPLYTSRPVFYIVISLCVAALMTLPFFDQMQELLDPEETGNSIRLGLLNDYARILSDRVTLLFGRGLGAYELWTARTPAIFSSVSELTFFEIIRNFGIIGGPVMIGLLIVPSAIPFLQPSRAKDRSLAIAWTCYLVMSFSNPILFNSMGILILAALLGEDRRCQNQNWYSCGLPQAPDRLMPTPITHNSAFRLQDHGVAAAG